VSKWEKLRNVISRTIRERHTSIPCTIMFDYYGMPHDWPGRVEAASLPSDIRADHIESKLAEDLSTLAESNLQPELFIPYVQMHEYEALLFSDTDRLVAAVYPSAADMGAKLCKDLNSVVASFDHPEQINDNYETSPARRLQSTIPRYKKTVDGVAAAKRIGIDRMREKCPHFNQWIMKLEALASPDTAG